jgi:hypothetical protein
VEVVATVAKSPVAVAVAEDEPPVEIATGVAQSPVAEAATPFAASLFAESGRNMEKLGSETPYLQPIRPVPDFLLCK